MPVSRRGRHLHGDFGRRRGIHHEIYAPPEWRPRSAPASFRSFILSDKLAET